MNIPFIFNVTNNKDEDRGARVSAITNAHFNNTKVSLTNELRGSPAKGFWVAGVSNYSGDYKGIEVAGIFNYSGDYKGIKVAGLFNEAGGDFEGIQIAGINNFITKDAKGIQIAGITNKIDRDLEGVSYGTISNHAKSNGKIAIQIGAFNHIKEYNPEGLVIQLGISNRAGNQSIPFLNIRGLGNLFKKKGNDLESKIQA